MKRSIFFFSSLVIISLFIVSCSSSKYLPPDVSKNAMGITNPDNKAVVYIYRISSMGFAVGLSVDINNKEVTTFFPKQFYMWVLDPGKYAFTGHGENEDDLKVTHEPQKKYYIEVTPQMGWVKARCKLESVEPSVGSTKVQKCKLVGLNTEARTLLQYNE